MSENMQNFVSGLVLAGMTYKATPKLIKYTTDTFANIKNMDASKVRFYEWIPLAILGTGVIVPYATIAFVMLAGHLAKKYPVKEA